MNTSLKKIWQENYILFLLIPILVFYLFTLNNDWIPSQDSAVYITLGKSLSAGQGYTCMGYTHVNYPFLFPLTLAPIIELFGVNFFLMRLLVILMGVGALGLVFLLFKQIMGPRWGLVLMLLTGASEYHYFYSHHILSDIPYTFFSFLALWYYFTKNPEQSGRRSTFVLAGLMLTAYFTRTVGVTLVVAIILDELLRNQKKQAILLIVIFLIPVGLWSYRNMTVPREKQVPVSRGEPIDYFHEFFSRDLTDKEVGYIGLEDLGKRILRNAIMSRRATTILILSYSYESILSARIISVLLLVGFLWCLFKRRTVIEYYIFLYILIRLVWPRMPVIRYFVPIYPFLLYYLFTGISVIAGSLSKRSKFLNKLNRGVREHMIVMLGILMLGTHLKMNVWMFNHLQNAGYYREPVKNFLSSIEWVTRNTRMEDNIVSDRAPWVYLFSGRKTFSYALINEAEVVLDSIRQKGANYMITGRVTGYGYYLNLALTAYPQLFSEVYRKGDSAVYKIVPGELRRGINNAREITRQTGEESRVSGALSPPPDSRENN